MARECGYCGSEACYVVETRLGFLPPFRHNVVKRRRRCKDCRRCWWTLELYENITMRLVSRAQAGDLDLKPDTFTAGEGNDEDGEA